MERVRRLLDAHERLKHRIHSVRLPIHDRRALFAVKCVYAATPLLLGYSLMQYVTPDEKAMEEKLRAMEANDPERFARARQAAEANRRQLQEILEKAERAATQARNG
mmetsp:Transcript_13474/g.40886  ORF Transcript_13474/g.40886 Transcript_13474/m.40886 type:complete len:107 (-) Transcript_13474:482-802(-)